MDTPLTVLVIDDEKPIRDSFALLLRSAGCQVAAVESAELAIPMIPYVDAVLVDGLVGAGLVLCRIAAEQGKRAVLCSGDPDLCEEARRRGYGAVNKPPRVEALMEALGIGKPVELIGVGCPDCHRREPVHAVACGGVACSGLA